MKRIVFDDIIQTEEYMVIQLDYKWDQDFDGKDICTGCAPRIILSTDSLELAQRLLWQIATDDHTNDTKWHRPCGTQSFVESLIRHKSGRTVRRYIPHKF